MRIDNTTNNTYTPKFKANVVNTKTLNETMNYLEKNSNPSKGFYNHAQDFGLMKKIINAFEKHPSKENIKIEETHRYNELFNARGVISSDKATLVDTEPARSDSVAPVLNIVRRIIDPANKKSFNKLMGEEHANTYDSWWNKNIRPIWGKVNERFREETYFTENRDLYYNSKFNSQTGEKRNVTSTMLNGRFVDYNKIKEKENVIVDTTSKNDKKENKIVSFFKKIFS